jgi:outer membrane protein assembly factor BamB
MALHARFAAPLALAVAAALLVSGCGGGSGPVPTTVSPSAGSASSPQAAFDDAATATPQWLQPFLNGAHTGFNTLETTLSRTNVSGLTQLWSFSTGAQIEDPILVQSGVAFINSGDGYLYAVNATTGALVWKYQTYEGSFTGNAPAIAGAHIIVPCLVGGDTQKNAMCGINVSTGKRVWAYYVDCNCLPGAGVSAGPTVSGSTVVFDYQNGGTNTSYVIALNTKTGATLWAGPALPHGPSFWNAAIANGEVYYSTGSGVCSESLSSGAAGWCTNVGSEPSMAVANGVVYVNTYNNGVYALSASTGSQIWQYTPTAGNYSGYFDPPAVANGKVYVSGVGFSGNLYALNASNGAPIFNTSAAGSSAYTYSSPSVANGVVYVECQNLLCAFNSLNGKLLYVGSSGGSSQVSPAVVNGIVYEACGPNNACAYSLPAAAKRKV